jgi:ribosomal protein L16 Arg81 hydroxylase
MGSARNDLKDGKLSIKHERAEFQLGFLDAVRGFNNGESIVIRHSEHAHRIIETLANSFINQFGKAVNIHVYATPAGNEGFDWHYDCEDVFVIQSSGQKEFYLMQNREVTLTHQDSVPKSYEDFKQRSIGPEIRCLLKAGDFLYIPRGYWHKARAITDSFHLSVGINIVENQLLI